MPRPFTKPGLRVSRRDHPQFAQHHAITRGKRLVVLVGQKKTATIAVRNVSGRRPWSKLAAWLSADVSKR